MDLGDRSEDSTIDFTFSNRNVSAAPATLAGTPVISVYKANGTTQSTAGITLTVNFDALTGLNQVRIDTSADAFYATANDYSVVITTGTVNSVSVVGTTIATFSIENRLMRGTDSALLATNVPSNFNILVISGAGAADTNVQGFLNTPITEATAGRIANNFDLFWDNSNTQTTKVVDDVGSTGLTQQNVRDSMKLAPTVGSPAVGSVDEHLDDILTDTGTTLPDQISGLNDLSESQVNTQVLDVLAVDTFPELSSVPNATSSILDKINWLFSLGRNKLEQTSTTLSLRNDTDSGSIATSSVSDNGTTFTRNKFT